MPSKKEFTPGPFAIKLNAYIKQRGWDLKYIEENLEIPYVTLWTWINGRSNPPKWMQNQLFAALDKLGLPENKEQS